MYSINWKDFFKGLVLAILAPVLFVIQQSLDAGSLLINWKQIGIVAVSALIAYLGKQFFTDHVKEAQKVIQKEASK